MSLAGGLDERMETLLRKMAGEGSEDQKLIGDKYRRNSKELNEAAEFFSKPRIVKRRVAPFLPSIAEETPDDIDDDDDVQERYAQEQDKERRLTAVRETAYLKANDPELNAILQKIALRESEVEERPPRPGALLGGLETQLS